MDHNMTDTDCMISINIGELKGLKGGRKYRRIIGIERWKRLALVDPNKDEAAFLSGQGETLVSIG